MTSRLKRKLGELGVDTQSSKANENFCLIGTPLPPLEKSKDTGEFVPLWKQEVKDEKGRRRLHGAFTGGFSAGYFNTVGSKEGWTPSTFVSSRSDRAKTKAARPEDFMDEEDLAEVREGQKLVDTNEEMDIPTGDSRPGESDSITSALENALLPPARDSVGAKILRKMGWRLGHGIGPKVTYEQHRRQLAQSSSQLSDGGAMEEDEEARKHMYPPIDTKVPVFSKRDNSHGLGYQPGMGLTDMVSGKKEQSGPNLSAGFGLGALNDAEEDDLDVYDRGLNSSTSKLAYEVDTNDFERITLSNRSRPKLGVRTNQPSRPVGGPSGSNKTFKDGRPVLSGFVLSDKPVAEDRWFPLPDIPNGWTPNPRRVWEDNKENREVDSQQLPQGPVDHRAWKTGITADQRGSMLGETPLESTPRSVFDYLSSQDRERLLNIGKKPEQKETIGPEVELISLVVPHIDPGIAKAALTGFQPFTADPVKQGRYTSFLKSQAAAEELEIQPLPGQSTEGFNKELSDYAKSAQIFKPISGAMANRFASAAIVENAAKPPEGLHNPSSSSEKYAQEQKPKEEKKEEDPRDQAIRLNMFGPLTREVTPWQPARLLCKRFGVKDPNPDLSAAQASTSHPSTSKSAADEQSESQALTPDDIARMETGVRGSLSTRSVDKAQRKDLANIGLGDDETQGQDTLTYERPAMSIFKAIFASEDEESDDEKNEDAQADEATAPQSQRDPVDSKGADTSRSKEAQPSHNQHVDLISFKPTFVPRADREKGKSAESDKDKDRHKKKRKKLGKTLVSFEVDTEDGLQMASSASSKNADKKKSKKERERRKSPGRHDSDPRNGRSRQSTPEHATDRATDADKTTETQVEPSTEKVEYLSGVSRGRKRAVDFM